MNTDSHHTCSNGMIQTDSTLRETIRHGTKMQPVTSLHFFSGPGTLYPEHFFVGRHWHPNIEILFLQKGTYEFEINLERFILREGDICFLNSGDLHQITGIETATIHDVFIFDPKILSFSYEDAIQEHILGPFVNRDLVFPHILRPSDRLYPLLAPKIATLTELAASQSAGWYLRCKLMLLELICLMKTEGFFLTGAGVLSSADRQKISRYKQIISYMESHYSDSVTLSQLADAAGCNSQYLCRFFREITGLSPIRYLIAYRIEQSCLMLLETTKTVLEISLDCGFDNVSYFIRQFRRRKGCTPKEYRKQNVPDIRREEADYNSSP